MNRILFVVVMVLFLVVVFMRVYVFKLNHDIQKYRIENAMQKASLDQHSLALRYLQQQLVDSELAQTKLRDEVDRVTQLNTARNRYIERLAYENNIYRDWYYSKLPVPVGMRPAITGSDGFKKWLSESHAMSVTGQ